MIKFKNQPVVGMDVTLAKAVELWGDQELSSGNAGTVSIVREDEIVVRFEDIVSDKGGHLYSDYVTVELDFLPETFEEFAEHEIVDDEA